jgi:hypothetical protein
MLSVCGYAVAPVAPAVVDAGQLVGLSMGKLAPLPHLYTLNVCFVLNT